MKEMKKLYRAYSVIDSSNGNGGIRIRWYSADIKVNAINYGDIIKDSARMYVFKRFWTNQALK